MEADRVEERGARSARIRVTNGDVGAAAQDFCQCFQVPADQKAAFTSKLLLDQIVTAMLAFFMLMAPALVSESGFGSGLHLFVDLDGVASSEGLELRQHTPTKTYEMARPAQQTAPRAVQRAPC